MVTEAKNVGFSLAPEGRACAAPTIYETIASGLSQGTHY